jgi:membrane associated rhomboid family serine protease
MRGRAPEAIRVIVLPKQPGSGTRPVPVCTLALALASAVFFLVIGPSDRTALDAATTYYVESGLAAIELPRYREYLQRSTDSDAIARLTQLERATGAQMDRPADAAGAIEAVRGDRAFERDLHADKVVLPSDPAYADWKRERQQFDRLAASALSEQMRLSGQTWSEPWRLVTYLWLHPTAALWLTNLAVLLLIGPFAEAAAGAVLFLLCYVGGGAFSGVVNHVFSTQPAAGDWGALAALAGLLAAAVGVRPLAGRLALGRARLALPGLAAALLVIGVEVGRRLLAGPAAVDLGADVSGLAFGAGLATLFKLRDSRRVRDLLAPARQAGADAQAEDTRRTGSALAQRAQEAATRLETRRATELFRELVDQEPQQIEHLSGYLNVALLGPDEAVLQDAALRLLWLRTRSHSDQLRKVYLQLTQPKVLRVLPIDEHLRLARRLVKQREDAAALKVLDAILTDSHLRELYGRQLADCLLGIQTGYMRRGLTSMADTIRSRLTKYFKAPDKLGGLPPSSRRTTTLATTSLGPAHTRLPPRP